MGIVARIPLALIALVLLGVSISLADDRQAVSEIQQRFASRSELGNSKINVQIQGNKAILSGTVDWPSQKLIAALDSFVDGVTDVDTTGLLVKTPQQRNLTRSDNALYADLMALLEADSRLGENKPAVVIKDGVIELSGEFNNLGSKVAAEEDAANVLGAVKVDDRIQVRPTVSRTDDEVLDSLETILRADPVLSARSITAQVRSGTIQLGGVVATKSERRRAILEASRIPGAVGLTSGIRVVRYTKPTDQALKQEVEGAIYYDPILSPGPKNHIQVGVDNGKVELRGEVISWTEYMAATRDAFEAGAKSVWNKLKLSTGEPARKTEHYFAMYPGEVYPLDWKEEGAKTSTSTESISAVAKPSPTASPTPSPTPSPTSTPTPRATPTPSPTNTPGSEH